MAYSTLYAKEGASGDLSPHMDGLRFEFADESWLLLRPSGTDPVVRVYAEAQTIEMRDELLGAGCAIARGDFG